MIELTKNLDWQAGAACVGKEWFVEDGNLGKKREICASCPVTAECLEFALEMKDVSSVVYAGTTGNAREQML